MKRSSIRVRLTALYSALFLATSSVSLIAMNLILKHNLEQQLAGVPGLPSLDVEELEPPLEPHPDAVTPPARAAPALQPLADAVLSYQWIVSGVLIAALTLVSVLVGWWLAGRLLRPLHHITETARRLSVSNLHERIAHRGPPDELAVLANTFDAMLGRLEASVDSQRRFIANAAHELRTPLATQRAAIQIGLEEPSRERLTRVRQELLDINRRNERLIDGLLVLAQGEHGLDTKEPVALDALVRQAVGEITAENGVAITQQVEPMTVEGDSILLQRLIHNLLHNAVQYNRPNGYVELLVTAAGALTVRNSGPEILEHGIGQMFEPFRRLHTERTGSTDGAGLGLSIVAAIARAHDASIAARPNPGGGLELTVQFRPLPQPGVR